MLAVTNNAQRWEVVKYIKRYSSETFVPKLLANFLSRRWAPKNWLQLEARANETNVSTNVSGFSAITCLWSYYLGLLASPSSHPNENTDLASF